MTKLQIYKITNQKNGKIYIGLTVQGWEKRVKRHFADAANGCEFKLHRAIRKYGSEHFEATLLETCNSHEDLKEREKFWISILETTNHIKGYNMTEGGDGTLGKKHSESTKSLLRVRARNRISAKHIPVELLWEGELTTVPTITLAAKHLSISRNTLYNKFNSLGNSFYVGETLVTRRDDLKTDPKPKKLGRDPEQVKAHMEMMQKKSSEARKNDKDYVERQRKAKADKVKPIYQFDLEGNLIKKHLGARQASEFSGVSRGGIRNCIKCKSHICKKFIWSLTDDQEFINEIINSKVRNLVVG